jgi:hypothetical protein
MSTYSTLKIQLIGTGEQAGAWGVTTNNNLGSNAQGSRGIEQAIVGMANLETADFTANQYTMTTLDSNAAQDFRAYVLNITATLSANGTVNVPAIQKPYIVFNNSVGGYSVTVKVVGQPGVLVPNGKKTFVYNDAGDVGVALNYLPDLSLGTALPVGSGGLGATNLTGILKGNGSSPVTTATPGTDYLTAPSGTAIQKANNGGSLANAVAGTDYIAPPSGTAILKANSGGALANAIAGTDYVDGATPTNFTATQTFTGSASTAGVKLFNALENVTIEASSLPSTYDYDVLSRSIVYCTANAANNWTVNFRGSSVTSLNSVMAIGESVTVVVLATQGATAYYNTSVTVDGSSVTPKWQISAPVAGNPNSIDAYTYTIVKTASATYTIFASQARFV